MAEVLLYPVKSARCLRLTEAVCDREGLRMQSSSITDRSFVVYDSKTKQVVTGRQKAKLVAVEVFVEGGVEGEMDGGVVEKEWVVLRTEGVGEVRVEVGGKGDMIQTDIFGSFVEGVDCGEEASVWLQKLLEGEEGRYRLLGYQAGVTKKRMLKNMDDAWTSLTSEQDHVTYQDGYPYLLVTSASLQEVVTRVEMESHGNQPITQTNFRPNFYVLTTLAPFDEDGWVEVRIGECVFLNVKPCTRCVLTTVDPSGVRRNDMQPLKSLRRFRLMHEEFGTSPCFGVNLVLLKGGVVREGDVVEVKRCPT